MTYLIENILQPELCQRRALHILHRAQFLRHPLAVLLSNRLHLLLRQFLPHSWVITQIYLCADNQAGHAGAVVMHLGEPLLPNVLEGRGRRHREADEEDISLWIGQGSETIVVFLSSRIEEAEGIWFVTNPARIAIRESPYSCMNAICSHYGYRIVVENCRHIFRGELVRGVAD